MVASLIQNTIKAMREIRGKDSGEILYEARWMSLASFRDNSAPPLYPNGLLDLLDNSDAS